MAGGSRSPRRTIDGDLIPTPRRSGTVPLAREIAAATSLLLVACLPQQAAPTPDLAPTLVVVTATPGPPAVPTPGVEQRYVVRDGDTLSGIAARFGVSEDAILDANGISDPDRILVGQELIVPPAQP
jgi:LysM repeat protein